MADKQRRAKQDPSYTVPMRKLGDERVRPGGDKADYAGKFSRPQETPYMGKPQGGYDHVGNKAKATKGDGSERVRKEKVDYQDFSKPDKTPFMGKPQGGYNWVGDESKATKGDGKERVRPEKVDYQKFEKTTKGTKKPSPFDKGNVSP